MRWRSRWIGHLIDRHVREEVPTTSALDRLDGRADTPADINSLRQSVDIPPRVRER